MFLPEAQEHAARMTATVARLWPPADVAAAEQPPLSAGAQQDAIEGLFLSAHTIKGGAAMLGFDNTRRAARLLEVIAQALAEGRLAADGEVVEFIRYAVAQLIRLLDNIEVATLDERAVLLALKRRFDRLRFANREVTHV